MTPNVVLSGTVNPDFYQVEADAAQLDVNTQFQLRFPEKRPFFVEGADLFRTPIEALFTRTIADPRPVSSSRVNRVHTPSGRLSRATM